MFGARALILLLATVLLLAAPDLASAAITVTQRAADRTGVDASSFTTASFTLTANCLGLAWINSGDTNSAVPTPTVTDAVSTWTMHTVKATTQVVTDDNKLFFFHRMHSSDITGTVTIDYGESQYAQAWTFLEICGTNTSGTNGSGAIVQAVTGNVVGATTITLTLAAFGASANRPFMGVGGFLQDTNGAPESGWTELSDTAGGADGFGTYSMWKDASDDVSGTVTYTDNEKVSGIIVEVKAATSTVRRLLLLGVE